MTEETYEPALNGADSDPEGERIVSQIEETRTEMAGTIDQIGHRLQPQTIANEAREKVREATVGKVERMVSDAGQSVQRTSNGVVDTIRQNPVPAALAAIGVGWLAMKMRDQSSSPYGDSWRYSRADSYANTYQPSFDQNSGNGEDALQRARRTTQDVADQAAQRAQQVGSDVQRTAQDALDGTSQRLQDAQWQVDRTWNDNPLALGALAVGVGAAVALAIPETQKERELLGEQRDKLVEKVSSAASGVMDEAQTKAQELAGQVTEGSSNSGNLGSESEAVYTAHPNDQG